MTDILSDIGSILIKENVFSPEKVEKFNESDIFQVSEIFLRGGGGCVCFGTAAFDTDNFQRTILYQKEGHPLSGDMIIFCVG